MNVIENTTSGSMKNGVDKVDTFGVFANITQRKPRKSTLGRIRRESKRIIPETPLFSIHEEPKSKDDHNNSLNELEEAVRKAEISSELKKQKTISSGKANSTTTTNYLSRVKNNTFNDITESNVTKQIDHTLTEISQNTPVITRKKYSQLFFESKNKYDNENSFIDTENTLVNNNNSHMDKTLVPENVSNNIIKEKSDIRVAATRSTQKSCSFGKSICDTPKQLDALNSVMQKNSLLITEYNNKIEELKLKINEYITLNETLESIKLTLKNTVKTEVGENS